MYGLVVKMWMERLCTHIVRNVGMKAAGVIMMSTSLQLMNYYYMCSGDLDLQWEGVVSE